MSDPVCTDQRLCGICGEHANEHGAIPGHQFEPLDEMKFAAAIEQELAERELFEKFTTAQLVDALLGLATSHDCDALIEEACNRLEPQWERRLENEPLSPEDEAMVKRCHERFMKRLDELRASKP